MSLQFCWFRTDLRVHDNTALSSALKTGPTVALYVATPEQWRKHNDAEIKIDFWRRNLIELKNELTRINVPLLIFEVKSYAEIPQLFEYLISQLTLDGIHFNKEYPLNEKKRDKAVETVFHGKGINVSQYEDQVLLASGSVLNGSGQPFKVFTPFSKACKKVIGLSAVYPPEMIEGNSLLPIIPELSHSAARACLSEINWPAAKSQWQSNWPAGEKHAGNLLSEYCLSKISDYKQNRDHPSVNGTSKLSPYLTSGVVSIRECWRSARVFQDNVGVDTWLNELLWREFYKHIVFHFPHVCQNKPWRSKYDNFAWNKDHEKYEAWCQGKTGFPLIDAAMRQLLETGWMHNRLRMVCAMFLSKNLLIDWRLGENWFMSQLIDGDFSANNGGWQWASSTGTDAVPYFRVFNPVRQSERFDSEGIFIKHYLPELAHLNSRDIHFPENAAPASYPKPMVDLKISRLQAIEAFKSA